MTQEEKIMLKRVAYQLGIGAVMCLCLIAACSIGEILNRIY